MRAAIVEAKGLGIEATVAGWCLAILIAGCPTKAQVSLSKMRGLDVESYGGAIRVMMFVDDKTADQTPNCRIPAPKAKATFNGAPLDRITGMISGDEIALNADCILLFWTPGKTGNFQPGTSLLKIVEGSTKFELLIANAFTPRKLTLIAPADGILRRGETVTVRWQPATDLLQHERIGLSLRRRGAKVIEDDEVTIRHGDVSFQGYDMTFTVPQAAPRSLDGEIEIQFLGTAYVTPGLGSCPVDRCTVGLDLKVPPLLVRLR